MSQTPRRSRIHRLRVRSVGLRRSPGLARGRGLARRDLAALGLALAALAAGRRLGRGLALGGGLARGRLLRLRLGLRAGAGALAPAGLLRRLGGRTLDQLEDRDGCRVADAAAELQHARVASGALAEAVGE